MNTVLSQWRPKLPLTAWPPFAPRALAGGEGAGGMRGRPRVRLLRPQPCDRVLRDVIGEVVTFGEMLIRETNSVG
jgi:hypothetical protein